MNGHYGHIHVHYTNMYGRRIHVHYTNMYIYIVTLGHWGNHVHSYILNIIIILFLS